ncbi:MAG: hypothetical protein R2755_14155 [Acidimicrobiales bacterium]
MLAVLSLVERRLSAAISERMAPHRVVLRGSHARLLNLLPHGGARPTELTQGWIPNRPSASASGDGGRRPGHRRARPARRRATIVRRTAEGDRALALIRRELAALEAELARAVGERRRTFRAVLDELAAG